MRFQSFRHFERMSPCLWISTGRFKKTVMKRRKKGDGTEFLKDDDWLFWIRFDFEGGCTSFSTGVVCGIVAPWVPTYPNVFGEIRLRMKHCETIAYWPGCRSKKWARQFWHWLSFSFLLTLAKVRQERWVAFPSSPIRNYPCLMAIRFGRCNSISTRPVFSFKESEMNKNSLAVTRNFTRLFARNFILRSSWDETCQRAHILNAPEDCNDNVELIVNPHLSCLPPFQKDMIGENRSSKAKSCWAFLHHFRKKRELESKKVKGPSFFAHGGPVWFTFFFGTKAR